jgi:hypothetical protein
VYCANKLEPNKIKVKILAQGTIMDLKKHQHLTTQEVVQIDFSGPIDNKTFNCFQTLISA